MPKDKDNKTPPSADSQARAPGCRLRDPGAPPVTGKVFIDGDRIVLASESGAGREVYTLEDALKGVAADLVTVATVPGQLHKLPKVLGRLHSLVALIADIDVSKTAVKLPPNASEVQPAGDELVEVAATDPDASFLQVKVAETRQRLDRAAFVYDLHTQVAWLPAALHNTWTHEISTVHTAITEAYKDKVERVTANVRLAGKLPLSLEVVTGSKKKAAETMKEHQRVAKQAVAKDRAKQGTPPAAPPAPPPSDPTRKP